MRMQSRNFIRNSINVFFAFILIQSTFGLQKVSAEVVYSSPYKYNLGCTSKRPHFDTVGAAIDAWWSAYQRCWGSYFPCSFDLTTYPGNSGNRPNVFAQMLLTGNCTGGNTVTGTAYNVDDPTPDFEHASNIGNPKQCSNPTNPINLSTGNKYQKELDYQTSVINGLIIERHYNSNSEVLKAGILGQHWRSSYDREIIVTADSDSNEAHVAAYRSDGKIILFKKLNGEWASISDKTYGLFHEIKGGEATGWWELHNVDDTIEKYSPNGKLRFIQTRDGFETELNYDLTAVSGEGDDNSDTLDKVTDHFGRTLYFKYHTSTGSAYHGLLWKIIDSEGYEYVYDYDNDGNLQYVTYPSNSSTLEQRQYIYDDPNYPHALTGIIDERGVRSHSWGYDINGRAIFSEHGAQGSGIDRYDLTFNTDGTTTVQGPAGQLLTYHFETHNHIHKISQIDGGQCTSCGGMTKSTTYDTNGHIDTKTDFRGTVTDYTINTKGLEEQRVEAVGTLIERTTSTTWDTTFRLPLTITQPGQETKFSYDASGRVLTRTIEDTTTSETRVTAYTYYKASDFGGDTSDPRIGLLKTMDGPRVDVTDITTYAYDPQGNLTEVTNALGHETRITSYDNNGRALTTLDANNTQTILAYDSRGRLLTRTVDGQTTSFEYDEIGNITKTTLPNGAFLMNTYDAAQRLTGVQDNLGNTITYTLDNLGNRTKEQTKDPAGTLTRTLGRNYNSLNRLIETIGGEGQVTAFGYDANGNQTSITVDPSGLNQVTTQAFDALNRLSKTTDANLGETDYTYDGRGNLTSVKDAEGLSTTYSYDGLDNLDQRVSPDTNTMTYTHDEAGNVLSQTDARGVVTTYTYDALNRLTSTLYPGDPSQNITYTYDQSNRNGIGRLTSMSDASGQTNYFYDKRGNLIAAETSFKNGISYDLEYTYNEIDQLSSITYPTGRVIKYSYNGASQLANVTLVEIDGTESSLISDIAYIPFGPMKDALLGNGIFKTNNYDRDYRLKDLLVENVISRQYQFDDANNIFSIIDNYNSLGDQNFYYDGQNRIIEANLNNSTQTITYDQIGNRLTHNKDGDLKSYQYSPTSHRLIGIDSNTILSHDANGNTIEKDDYQFTYGANNRLAEVTQGITLANYIYNGRGERVIKNTDQTLYFIYDQYGQLIAEINQNDGITTEYIFADGNLITQLESSTDALLDKTFDDTGSLFSSSWMYLTNQIESYGLSYHQYDPENETLSSLGNPVDNRSSFFYTTDTWSEMLLETAYSGDYFFHLGTIDRGPGVMGVQYDDDQAEYSSSNWKRSGTANTYNSFGPYLHWRVAQSSTPGLLGTPVDDASATFTGTWTQSGVAAGYLGRKVQYHAGQVATPGVMGVQYDDDQAEYSSSNWKRSGTANTYNSFGPYLHWRVAQSSTPGLLGTPVDDASATFTGTWTQSGVAAGYLGRKVQYHAGQVATPGVMGVQYDDDQAEYSSSNWKRSGTANTYNSFGPYLHWRVAQSSTPGLLGTPVDDASATFTGTWTQSGVAAGYLGRKVQYHAGQLATPGIMGYQLDNTDAIYQGSWAVSESNAHAVFGKNTHYHAAGSGSNTATWNLNQLEAGYYDIYASWLASSNRASNAKFTITNSSSLETVEVNQQINGGEWNQLGTFYIDPTSQVVLSDDANGYVSADGITLLPAGTVPQPLPVRDKATWALNVPSTGSYDVYVTWGPYYKSRATNAQYIVNHEGGAEVVTVNQRADGTQWTKIGTWTLTPGSTVDLSSVGNGYVMADGVTALPADTELAPIPEGETATWSVGVDEPGEYDVYASWHTSKYSPNYASDAKYIVHHQDGYEIVSVNQRIGGGQWNKLGTFSLDQNSRVELSAVANGAVIADGITLLPAGTVPQPLPVRDKATWALNVPSTGSYDVYVTWGPYYKSRATNAQYIVNHEGGAEVVTVNQRADGTQWTKIGTWTLTPGSTVDLSSVGNGYVMADGVTALPADTELAPIPEGETATWSVGVDEPGEYDVYASWHTSKYSPNYASDAKYIVHHQDGYEIVSVNQRIGGGQWNKLGTFSLDQNSKVELSAVANGAVIADGITLLPAGTVPQPLPVRDKATWALNVPSTGSYDVYVTWGPYYKSRATNAQYIVNHEGGAEVVTVNQRADGTQWTKIGTWTLTPGSTVDLSSVGNGYVMADGVTALPADTELAPIPEGETATWSVGVDEPGEYDVYASWHTSKYSPNYASDAKYIVHHQDGYEIVSVNQRIGGGQWNKLGTFSLDQNSRVELSAVANGAVIADGITLLPAGTEPQLIPQGEIASWSLDVAETAQYDVYATWPAASNHATDASYLIYHTGGIDRVQVNQQTGGGVWHKLGTYTLDAASKVNLSSVANGVVAADAVTILPSGSTDNENTALWRLNLPESSEYTLSARWPAQATNASDATFRVTHQGGVDHITVNQQQNSAGWQELGSYLFDQNSKVELLAQGNGLVIADAIKLTSTEATSNTADIYYVHTDHLGTPQALTDQDQGIVWQATYDVFGKADIEVETVTHNVRFPGQYYDQETGLHYNYFRDYDPETGRYIQSDPIGLDGGINTYLYANADPVSMADPTGETAVHAAVYVGGIAWKLYKHYKKMPCYVYRLRDCKGKLVYIGISKTPPLRMYGHRSSRGVIGKYGCDKSCPVTMHVDPKGYKTRAKCRNAERRLIHRNKPIWNTQHNSDPNKHRKREAWRRQNCNCNKK